MTNGTKLCIIVARTEHDWLHLECFGKINTQSNNQSQKFGAKNKYTEKLNFLFFSFHFTFYVYTFRRMLAIGILCIPVYACLCYVCLRCQCSFHVRWSRRQYDWMLTIKIKEKNRAQPATHTVKKGKRKGKRKNAKQHNKNCQMKKKEKENKHAHQER